MIEPKIDTTNVKVLEDFFTGLSSINQRKIFTAGFRRAAKPLTAMAKATVPVRSGNLRKSIGSLMTPREISIIIGARKYGASKGHHGHLVESGTTARFRKSGGATGTMPSTGFFEAAYESTKGQIFANIEQEWYKEIDKFIVRTNRKAK